MGEVVAKSVRRSGRTMIQRSRQKSSEEKALYHNVTGAGRSRVIRQFMGLTTQEEKDIETRVERHITQQLRAR